MEVKKCQKNMSQYKNQMKEVKAMIHYENYNTLIKATE